MSSATPFIAEVADEEAEARLGPTINQDAEEGDIDEEEDGWDSSQWEDEPDSAENAVHDT
ncbi:hypothetical protein F441_22671, partial [Phytophthora nicotianae CJ01A1]